MGERQKHNDVLDIDNNDDDDNEMNFVNNTPKNVKKSIKKERKPMNLEKINNVKLIKQNELSGDLYKIPHVILNNYRIYVFPLKKCFFKDYEKLNEYGDFNVNDQNASLVFTLFQLMLHVASVAIHRVPVGPTLGDNTSFPFQMYVESLVDDDGVNVEWRVYICEEIDNNGRYNDISLVFLQAVNSGDFKLNCDGIYCKNADPEAYTKKSMLNMHNDSISDNLPKEYLYKKMKNQDIVGRWICAYLIMCGLSSEDADRYAFSPSLTTLPACFSLENAIAVTSVNVCKRQRTLRTYLENNSKFTNVYDISKYVINGFKNGLYSIGRSLIGTQFLHKPFFEIRVPKMISLAERALEGFIIKLAEKSVKSNGRNKCINNLISKEFNSMNIDDGSECNNSPVLSSSSSSSLRQQQQQFKIEPTVKEVNDIFDDYGINKLNATSQDNNSADNIFKDDKVYILQKYYEVCREVLDAAEAQGLFSSPEALEEFKREHADLLEHLDDDQKLTVCETVSKCHWLTIFKRAICDIYEKSSVSEQVDEARKDILSFSPRDVKIPITDTTLGPDSHFFIWFTNGLKELMGITFLNVLGMKLFTSFGNIGNRDPRGKYHINIPGDAAAGKSHLIRILMEVVGPYFFKNVSNVSPKRYGVMSEYFRDMVICKDEGNILNIATAEGDVAGFWRTLLSEGEAEREVANKDGDKRGVLKIKVVNACQMLELTNLSDSNAISKLGVHAPVATALASRKQNFSVMSYTSNLESVTGIQFQDQ